MLLSRAIDSVLAQTRPADEVIVVDDGSTDNTEAVVRERYGNRVRYIRQENGGTSAARNRGVREAQGDWLSFLDHDDEWFPRRLELHAAAIASDPETAVIYSTFYVTGHRKGERVMAAPPPPESLYPRLRLQNMIPMPATSMRKDAYLAVGGFNEALRGSCEDWDLLVRMTRRYRATMLQEPLLLQHEQPSSQSLRYRMMLERERSIVETTLLEGITGWKRMVWRRRVLSALYARAAVGARECGDPGWQYLLKSFGYWPVPEPLTGRSRLKTMAADIRDVLAGRTKKL